MDADYMSLLTKASNEIWTVFRDSVRQRKIISDKEYDEIRKRYKGTEVEKYVKRYITHCCKPTQQKGIDDPEWLIGMARQANREMWVVFKEYMQKVLSKAMTDKDWSEVSEKLDLIYRKSYLMTKAGQYAKNYSLVCMDELDRKHRQVNDITDDLVEYMTKKGG